MVYWYLAMLIINVPSILAVYHYGEAETFSLTVALTVVVSLLLQVKRRRADRLEALALMRRACEAELASRRGSAAPGRTPASAPAPADRGAIPQRVG